MGWRLGKELGLTKAHVIWMGGRSFPAVDRRCGIFAENLERAFEEGLITSYEDDRLYDTDMIVQGLRTSDNTTVYVAVEGAGVISAMDIDLARESADILTKLYDAPAISAVYGTSLWTIAVQNRESGRGPTLTPDYARGSRIHRGGYGTFAPLPPICYACGRDAFLHHSQGAIDYDFLS